MTINNIILSNRTVICSNRRSVLKRLNDRCLVISSDYFWDAFPRISGPELNINTLSWRFSRGIIHLKLKASENPSLRFYLFPRYVSVNFCLR